MERQRAEIKNWGINEEDGGKTKENSPAQQLGTRDPNITTRLKGTVLVSMTLTCVAHLNWLPLNPIKPQPRQPPKTISPQLGSDGQSKQPPETTTRGQQVLEAWLQQTVSRSLTNHYASCPWRPSRIWPTDPTNSTFKSWLLGSSNTTGLLFSFRGSTVPTV